MIGLSCEKEVNKIESLIIGIVKIFYIYIIYLTCEFRNNEKRSNGIRNVCIKKGYYDGMNIVCVYTKSLYLFVGYVLSVMSVMLIIFSIIKRYHLEKYSMVEYYKWYIFCMITLYVLCSVYTLYIISSIE
jgi:hypothetical protein